jgi:N-acetylneuraminate synthase
MMKVIAEAGVNHNGDAGLAFDLINAASESGADVIKFQTFRTDKLVTDSTRCANYQITGDHDLASQKTLLSNLELPFATFEKLKLYCDDIKIEFMTTAFDSESLRFVNNHLNLNTLKISSGDLTNAPFLLEHARTQKKILLSTGLSNISEIRNALSVLAYGYLEDSKVPKSTIDLQSAFNSTCGQKILKEKVTLLHCNSAYPTPYSEVNLNAIESIYKEFNLAVGFSDHSIGIAIPIASVALGITVLEKHITLDKTRAGPDHKVSLEPNEFKKMVEGIHQVYIALGNGEKVAMPAEKENSNSVRRTIVAETSITKGEVFSDKNLAIKRGPVNMSPYEYWRLLGSKSSRAYSSGDLIDE